MDDLQAVRLPWGTQFLMHVSVHRHYRVPLMKLDECLFFHPMV